MDEHTDATPGMHLPPFEWSVMRAVWHLATETQPTTAAEVRDWLAANGKDRAIATVTTILGRLDARSLLRTESVRLAARGKLLYYPLLPYEAGIRRQIEGLVDAYGFDAADLEHVLAVTRQLTQALGDRSK
jgi:predicted transcriptional regulator